MRGRVKLETSRVKNHTHKKHFAAAAPRGADASVGPVRVYATDRLAPARLEHRHMIHACRLYIEGQSYIPVLEVVQNLLQYGGINIGSIMSVNGSMLKRTCEHDEDHSCCNCVFNCLSYRDYHDKTRTPNEDRIRNINVYATYRVGETHIIVLLAHVVCHTT